MQLTLLAPAKINLYLEVLKKLPSEHLHKIETIMQSVSLFDVVKIYCKKNHKNENKIKIFTDCKTLNKLPENKNLSYIAGKLFFEVNKIYGYTLKINIKKNIPMNAGLAGGSTDAAAVLVGLNYLFENVCNDSTIKKTAEKIGTDVPFFLHGGTAISKDFGAQPKKIKDLKNFCALVCKPNFDVFTQIAYKDFDQKYEIEIYKKNNIDNIINAINNEDITLVAEKLYNRFEAVVQSNEVTFVKNLMKKGGALGALMSGTGSSIFGIFKEKLKAAKCQEILKKNYKNVSLCEPINFGCKILGKS